MTPRPSIRTLAWSASRVCSSGPRQTVRRMCMSRSSSRILIASSLSTTDSARSKPAQDKTAAECADDTDRRRLLDECVLCRYQGVIKEIAAQMAEGMAIYQTKEVATLKDYDSYCYYVAGLVGVGLTR